VKPARLADGRMELRIAGTGGQGLLLAGRILADALMTEGRHVAQSQTYEPTSRGGYCNADLVVADGAIDYPLATALDALVLLDRLAVAPSWPLLKPGALVIADTRLCPELPEMPELPAATVRALHLPLTRTAIELGSERVANIVALGALAALTDLCDLDVLAHKVRVEAPRSLVHLNLDALGAGIGMAGQPLTAG
jgi:2-oxoglutarate ferredoxin oxidoreductase subunit gamma